MSFAVYRKPVHVLLPGGAGGDSLLVNTLPHQQGQQRHWYDVIMGCHALFSWRRIPIYSFQRGHSVWRNRVFFGLYKSRNRFRVICSIADFISPTTPLTLHSQFGRRWSLLLQGFLFTFTIWEAVVHRPTGFHFCYYSWGGGGPSSYMVSFLYLQFGDAGPPHTGFPFCFFRVSFLLLQFFYCARVSCLSNLFCKREDNN